MLQRSLSECVKQALLVVIQDVESARHDRKERPPRDPTSFSWSSLSRFREAVVNFIQHQQQRRRRRRQQQQSTAQDWEVEYGEIILWMACLGGQRAEDDAHDDEDDDRGWFLGLASDLAHRRAIATPDGVVQLMSRYLHRCEPTGRPSISGLEGILREN